MKNLEKKNGLLTVFQPTESDYKITNWFFYLYFHQSKYTISTDNACKYIKIHRYQFLWFEEKLYFCGYVNLWIPCYSQYIYIYGDKLYISIWLICYFMARFIISMKSTEIGTHIVLNPHVCFGYQIPTWISPLNTTAMYSLISISHNHCHSN